MSDETRDVIRGLAIERLSLALAQDDTCRCEPSMFRSQATRLLDALGDLLPTHSEIRRDGVFMEMGTVAMPLGHYTTEYRYCTDWTKAPE